MPYDDGGMRDWQAERDYDWGVTDAHYIDQVAGNFRHPFRGQYVQQGQVDAYDLALSAYYFSGAGNRYEYDSYEHGREARGANLVERAPLEGMWDDPYWGELDENGVPQRIFAYMFGAELDPGFESERMYTPEDMYGPPKNFQATSTTPGGGQHAQQMPYSEFTSEGDIVGGGALLQDAFLTNENFELQYDATFIENTGTGWGADPGGANLYATNDILAPNTPMDWYRAQNPTGAGAYNPTNLAGWFQGLALQMNVQNEQEYWNMLNFTSGGEQDPNNTGLSLAPGYGASHGASSSYYQDWRGKPRPDQYLLNKQGDKQLQGKSPVTGDDVWFFTGHAPGSDFYNATAFGVGADIIPGYQEHYVGGAYTIGGGVAKRWYDDAWKRDGSGDIYDSLVDMAEYPENAHWATSPANPADFYPGYDFVPSDPSDPVDARNRDSGVGFRQRDLSGRLITPRRQDIPMTPGRRASRKAEEGLLESYFGGSLLGGGA